MDIPHAEQQKCHWHLNLQGIKNKSPRGQKARLGNENPEAKTISASPFALLDVHWASSTVLLGCGCDKNINPANFNQWHTQFSCCPWSLDQNPTLAMLGAPPGGAWLLAQYPAAAMHGHSLPCLTALTYSAERSKCSSWRQQKDVPGHLIAQENQFPSAQRAQQPFCSTMQSWLGLLPLVFTLLQHKNQDGLHREKRVWSLSLREDTPI